MEEENVGTAAVGLPIEEPKVHTQDDLQRVVKREKAEVEARIRAELETQHQAELESLRMGTTQNLGGMKDTGVDVDQIYNQVASKFQAEMKAQQDAQAEQQYQAEMKRVADNYFGKLKAGKERYNDFDEIVGDFEHENFPQLVFALSGMDNSADVLYELNKNPGKLEQIDYWLTKSPKKGMQMLHQLSDSINQTRAAQSEYEPTNPPLSQIRQSNVGMDSGAGSLESLKRDPSLMF